VKALFIDAIEDFEIPGALAVAFSGGADSTALLVACARKWPRRVFAVHINHGLQSAAEAFEMHCISFCNEHSIPIFVERVQAKHITGQSPEDAARRARYAGIENAVNNGFGSFEIKDIALAQHADDQVETLLLALSRGSGLPGLSGMSSQWIKNGITYHRPLLKVAGSDLRNWLIDENLSWCEDPSNQDQKFTRNKIRAEILPLLNRIFPAFRTTFSRSSENLAQAQVLLNELAILDLGKTGSPPNIKLLQSISRNRQGNLLRYWLFSTYAVIPSSAQMNELLDQISACVTRGHQIDIKVADGFIVRQADSLHWYNLKN